MVTRAPSRTKSSAVAAPIPPEQEASVTIRYKAQPEKGLYFRTPDMGYKPGDEHLFTQGEAIDERYWYPSYDSPNEKFTTEITCHVPAGMIALSNGRLISEEKDSAGLTAFHWSQVMERRSPAHGPGRS